MPFQTIVVPLDFSDESRAALDTAIEIAKQAGATLHLVHAYQIIVPTAPMIGAGVPPDLMTSVREAASSQLAEWSAIPERAGLKTESHLSPASPSLGDRVHGRGGRGRPRVMGTRGLSGLKHVMLGSVAERTVRMAPCPVLTVKAAASDS